MDTTKTIGFISTIIYPMYHPVWFILYMYFKYHSVFKRKTKYHIETLSDEVLWNIIRTNSKSGCDVNNCVIVHPDNIYPSDSILLLSHADTKATRKVIAISDDLCKKHKLYISYTLFYNDFMDASIDFDVRLLKPTRTVQFAQEIQLSLIANPYDISNALVDQIIEGYFTLPKIIYKNDIISINIKNFAPASFYADLKANSIGKIYFKCNKITFNDCEVPGGYFCAIGPTSIKQSANIQSFVPRVFTEGTRSVRNGIKSFSEVWGCPGGLERYLEMVDVAVHPFLNLKKLKLRPVFLIQGEEGCGEELLMNLLASELGMHHYQINNSDLAATVYAQNESKLNNVFFNAKMSAPCIVSIHKFQNFGKNNEGQYDQRLISAFTHYLSNLFDNNPFPVVLFCCSNSKDIPAELKRVFLEVFDIDAPTDTEREGILKWLAEKNDIQLEGVDLKNISNKTNGFYYQDLKALVYYAENYFYKNRSTDDASKVVLREEDFQHAIDFMQLNYNESLGAPRVPKVQWSDVGGLTDVKEEIIKTINLPLKHPELFKSSGLSRSGILLFGPPGTGKTLIAKAVATECSLCFLTVKGPELLNMYVGQSEQNVREVFERARQASPCIIFFDELDSLAPNRGLSGDSGGVMDRVVSQLLAEMDGLESSGKVFIIGATNRPDLIDPALLRPGRFDKLLYVGPCTDLESKTSVIEALTRKFKLADDVNLKEIVQACPRNITGADFYGICSNAWSSAAKRLIEQIEIDHLNFDNISHKDVVVGCDDFNLAIKNVKPSISEKDLKYFDKLKRELSSNASVKEMNEISKLQDFSENCIQFWEHLDTSQTDVDLEYTED